ncbi:MAG: aldo/keto reductase [Planctomycetota bacterium]|nr:aldo/keto reductase [Planctomycetota bacterium]
MTYRPLGRCGTKVSTLSLGGWTTFGGSITDDALTRTILHAAFEAGINFFDIADVYARGAAETSMGKALAELPRRHLVISSKCYWPMSEDVNDRGLSRKHIFESVHDSLRRIGTDYLDILFCHRYDAETPVEETVRAMDDLVRQGKVLYWGTSEWTGAQLDSAHEVARTYGAYGPQVEQPQYSLLVREKVESDVRPVLAARGMGMVVWSPLASGLLTGKYDDGVPPDSRLARIDWLRESLLRDEQVTRVKAMRAVADDLRCSRTQLALAWAAAQPGVSSVILGATSVAQLEENLGALAVELTPAATKALDGVFPATS